MTSALPTGTGPDAVARLLAEKIQTRRGVTVIVDPKPGVAGTIAINAAKARPPTGVTSPS